jgi:hypothetical protein
MERRIMKFILRVSQSTFLGLFHDAVSTIIYFGFYGLFVGVLGRGISAS